MGVPAESIRAKFRTEVRKPVGSVDLARAALLVAAEEYPQLSPEVYLGRLDLLAVEIEERLKGETAPLVVLDELIEHLFRRKHLRGNREAYYDPRNSFLNDVLERGKGIPLTLGIAVLEVGWRLRLPLVGVNFPGHFLVRFEGESMRLLIDPFNSGERRFEDEAQQLLDRTYGGVVRLQERFLRTADRHAILVRLLTNLKGIYGRVSDHRRSVAVIERLLELDPEAYPEVRDLGVALAKLGRWDEATQRLEQYLRTQPDCPDAPRIEDLLTRIRRKSNPKLGEALE